MLRQYKNAVGKDSNVPESDLNLQNGKELIKTFALHWIISYMHTMHNHGKKCIRLVDLGEINSSFLAAHGENYCFYSSRFFEMLKAEMPNLKDFITDKNVRFV